MAAPTRGTKIDTATDTKIWIPTTKDEYPQIVEGGVDMASGQTIYVGRGQYANSIEPGNVFKPKVTGTCKSAGLYFANGGQVRYAKDYEMLVTTKRMKWVPEHDGGVPVNAVVGGSDSDGNTLYVARARTPDGGLRVGKLYPPHKQCVYAFEGKECESPNYEVLADSTV